MILFSIGTAASADVLEDDGIVAITGHKILKKIKSSVSK